MSISGSLSDIAVVDLLQFLHMSQRSGTLLLEHDEARAHISFHRGRIASAWGPCSGSVVQYLLDKGVASEDDIEMAEVLRRQKVPPSSLGQALLDARIVTWAELRDAVCRKIERTIFELISWRHGRFHVIADEVRGDDEMTFAPGDVVPNLDLDTQAILLEAVRLFDERNRLDQPADAQPALAAHTIVKPGEASRARPRASACIQIVSSDTELTEHVGTALAGLATVTTVDLRDAGIPAPGEAQPVVVVDRRRDGVAPNALSRIRELHPRSPVIALVASPNDVTRAFEEGAVAVTELAQLPACCTNLVRSSVAGRDHGAEGNLRSGLARLRRVLGDLRSGLLSATVSLNLMSIVADSVERAVLFVQQRDALIALGAFGATLDGRPLANLARGLVLPLAQHEFLARCIADGRALPLSYDESELPGELARIVDRPRSGQGVFFPVLGARRAIGLIYADNGRRTSSIQDVEIVELATAQVGLAFENELLRRQVDRAAPDAAS
jgi:Domain of unknown function (DUF4388)